MFQIYLRLKDSLIPLVIQDVFKFLLLISISLFGKATSNKSKNIVGFISCVLWQILVPFYIFPLLKSRLVIFGFFVIFIFVVDVF